MKKIFEYNAPFTFVIGARRTGKTYGAFYNAIMNKDRVPFGIMRRTGGEMEIMTSPEYNPFRELNNDYGWNYGIFGNPATKKRTANVYNQQEKEGIIGMRLSVLNARCQFSLSGLKNTSLMLSFFIVMAFIWQ